MIEIIFHESDPLPLLSRSLSFLGLPSRDPVGANPVLGVRRSGPFACGRIIIPRHVPPLSPGPGVALQENSFHRRVRPRALSNQGASSPCRPQTYLSRHLHYRFTLLWGPGRVGPGAVPQWESPLPFSFFFFCNPRPGLLPAPSPSGRPPRLVWRAPPRRHRPKTRRRRRRRRRSPPGYASAARQRSRSGARST